MATWPPINSRSAPIDNTTRNSARNATIGNAAHSSSASAIGFTATELLRTHASVRRKLSAAEHLARHSGQQQLTKKIETQQRERRAGQRWCGLGGLSQFVCGSFGRTRKGKAKLANHVIPVAPFIKRKLIMDITSDDEPSLKSQNSKKICVYPSVTREFYTNLTDATVDKDSPHYHNVYIRKHCFAILLRLATTNWLPTVIVDTVSKKMVVLLFKIRNNIQFDVGELIFHHIMGFCHGWGKEDKVLLPFSSLIYGESVPSNLPCVSLDFAAAHARVLSTQSILTGLKSSTIV
nr:uncharacterized protein LOC109166029 [Ipomoea batatas]